MVRLVAPFVLLRDSVARLPRLWHVLIRLRSLRCGNTLHSRRRTACRCSRCSKRFRCWRRHRLTPTVTRGAARWSSERRRAMVVPITSTSTVRTLGARVTVVSRTAASPPRSSRRLAAGSCSRARRRVHTTRHPRAMACTHDMQRLSKHTVAMLDQVRPLRWRWHSPSVLPLSGSFKLGPGHDAALPLPLHGTPNRPQ